MRSWMISSNAESGVRRPTFRCSEPLFNLASSWSKHQKSLLRYLTFALKRYSKTLSWDSAGIYSQSDQWSSSLDTMLPRFHLKLLLKEDIFLGLRREDRVFSAFMTNSLNVHAHTHKKQESAADICFGYAGNSRLAIWKRYIKDGNLKKNHR